MVLYWNSPLLNCDDFAVKIPPESVSQMKRAFLGFPEYESTIPIERKVYSPGPTIAFHLGPKYSVHITRILAEVGKSEHTADIIFEDYAYISKINHHFR